MTEGTGTVLAVERRPSEGMSVYDRLDPMEFINQAGKIYALTGAGGCQTESDGKLMALAVLSRKMDVFEIARRYHLMAGKLVVKAEIMLGDFRRAGGSHRWINDGDDGKTATLELTDSRGNVGVTTFTLEKAVAAGYVKPGSQWVKRPDQMLRARCTTDGIRKLCPEISSGEFVEEEVDDFAPQVKAAAKQPRTTPAATTVTATTTPVVVAATPTREPGDESEAGEVTDVHAEPVEAVPFDVPGDARPDGPSTAVLLEIEAVIVHAGISVPQLLGSLNAKNNTAYTKLDQLSADGAETLLGNLRKAIAARAAQ